MPDVDLRGPSGATVRRVTMQRPARPPVPPPAARADDEQPPLHAPLRLQASSVADRRGLTALGAVAAALGLGLLGGAWDVATGPGLRTAFAVCFVAGCALAAAAVHREDLRAAVVMSPLVYLVLALLAGAVERTGAGGSWLVQQALELASSLVLGAPVLLLATGLAVAVAGTRAWRGGD